MFYKKRHKELKERISLLEMENEKLAIKLDCFIHKIENPNERPKIVRTNTNTIIGELNYMKLRKKYRSYTPKYNDGI